MKVVARTGECKLVDLQKGWEFLIVSTPGPLKLRITEGWVVQNEDFISRRIIIRGARELRKTAGQILWFLKKDNRWKQMVLENWLSFNAIKDFLITFLTLNYRIDKIIRK